MLPNLVIIGAMKCATVSLHKYLALHPQICMSHIHEIDFFVEELNWSRGTAWYESHFKESAQIMGERSTSYTKYPMFTGVPARMHNLLPEAKLIYSVRDPIRRIVSHYRHWYHRRYENRGFAEALTNLRENHYVETSMYYMQLEQYLAYYSAANILVISVEDLAQKRKESLTKVFQFLGIDTSFEHEDFFQVHHRSSELTRSTELKLRLANMRGVHRLERILPWLFERPVERPVLTESLQQALVDVLHDDVEKLRAFTGCAFENWSL